MTTATLVPRTMGPATYGRYDLITMLTFWFTMLGGLGMGQVMNRQTPQLDAEGATDRLQAIFGNLLVLRVLSSVVVALLYFLVTRLWLRDLDWAVLLVLSVAVLLRGAGGPLLLAVPGARTHRPLGRCPRSSGSGGASPSRCLAFFSAACAARCAGT